MDKTLHFRCGTQELAGTLTVPDGPGPHPGALIVPGSGPVDRDSNHAKLPIGVTRELAEALAGTGFATLRYDKRGVGESPGNWLAAGLGDNIDDASAALAALRAQGGDRAGTGKDRREAHGAVDAAPQAAVPFEHAGRVADVEQRVGAGGFHCQAPIGFVVAGPAPASAAPAPCGSRYRFDPWWFLAGFFDGLSVGDIHIVARNRRPYPVGNF